MQNAIGISIARDRVEVAMIRNDRIEIISSEYMARAAMLMDCKVPTEHAYASFFRLVMDKLKAKGISEIEGAVVSVSLILNVRLCQAIRAGAKTVGWKWIRILNAGIAAALSIGIEQKEDTGIAFCGLEEDGFWATIAEYGDGVVEILYLKLTDVFNMRQWKSFYDQFLRGKVSKINPSLLMNASFLESLDSYGWEALEELETREEVTMCVPYTKEESEDSYCPVKISRKVLEALWEPNHMEIISDFLNSLPENFYYYDDGIKKEVPVSFVWLYGARGTMKAAETRIQHAIDGKGTAYLEHAPVKGAALQAGKLTGNPYCGNFLLLDVAGLDLGIRMDDGSIEYLITADTTIGARKSRIFHVSERNVLLEFFQRIPCKNAEPFKIAEFRIREEEELKNRPENYKMQVTVQIDTDLQISVSYTFFTGAPETTINLEECCGDFDFGESIQEFNACKESGYVRPKIIDN